MGLFLKNLLFTILVPGTVAVFVPSHIISHRRLAIHWNAWSAIPLLSIVTGASFLLRCIWDFAVSGRGTPAPIDPPKTLVVRGPYRYVRNPMYFSVMLILVGQAWLFGSRFLLYYAVGTFISVNLLVLLYEEPHLRRTFGDAYRNYCKNVNRWLPGKPPQ